MTLTGPDRISRWVRARFAQEIGAALPHFDLDELARAGVKAIQARLEGVEDDIEDAAERARTFVAGAGSGVKDYLKSRIKKDPFDW